MGQREPTQVFFCDLCGKETTVRYVPEQPAAINANAVSIVIGGHRYDAGPCCTRGVWRYLAYVRQFEGRKLDGDGLPYIYSPSPEEQWSVREETVMAKLSRRGP